MVHHQKVADGNAPTHKNPHFRLRTTLHSYICALLLQSDAAAATSKAEATAAMSLEITAQREKMRDELEKAALTAERNTLMQGLVLSESERRKKVRTFNQGARLGAPWRTFPACVFSLVLVASAISTWGFGLLCLCFWVDRPAAPIRCRTAVGCYFASIALASRRRALRPSHLFLPRFVPFSSPRHRTAAQQDGGLEGKDPRLRACSSIQHQGESPWLHGGGLRTGKDDHRRSGS